MIQILNGDTLAIEVQWEWPSLRPEIAESGTPGLSAYQVALLNGFVGTESEWLASLRGPMGEVTEAERYRISGAPTQILDGETYIVPERRQVLFSLPITIDDGGVLQINGDLIEI